MNFTKYDTKSVQGAALAHIVAQELRDALAVRGNATLAVPGGTEPGVFLSALSQAELEWSKITVCLTDERQVP